MKTIFIIEYDGKDYYVPISVLIAVVGNHDHNITQPINIKVDEVGGTLVSIPLIPYVFNQIKAELVEQFAV
ncbi:MAG: hypothetical protein ACYDEX_25385 [Mobilitalea sp.]